jgi:hypothetical protein
MNRKAISIPEIAGATSAAAALVSQQWLLWASICA